MTKTKSVSIILIRQTKKLKKGGGLEVKKLDKRQVEYMARTIMPELYECQAVADASLEEFIRKYFGEDESQKEVIVSGE